MFELLIAFSKAKHNKYYCSHSIKLLRIRCNVFASLSFIYDTSVRKRGYSLALSGITDHTVAGPRGRGAGEWRVLLLGKPLKPIIIQNGFSLPPLHRGF